MEKWGLACRHAAHERDPSLRQEGLDAAPSIRSPASRPESSGNPLSRRDGMGGVVGAVPPPSKAACGHGGGRPAAQSADRGPRQPAEPRGDRTQVGLAPGTPLPSGNRSGLTISAPRAPGGAPLQDEIPPHAACRRPDAAPGLTPPRNRRLWSPAPRAATLDLFANVLRDHDPPREMAGAASRGTRQPTPWMAPRGLPLLVELLRPYLLASSWAFAYSAAI